MKSAIFGLLVACCAVQFASAAYVNLGPFESAIRRMKSDVQTIIRDMNRLESNGRFTLNSKLSNVKSSQMSNLNGYVNPALSSIRSAVDAAKKEGKDAEKCYTTAKSSLGSLSKDGFRRMDSCQNDAANSANSAFQTVSTVIQSANSQSNAIDMISVRCYSSDAMQMQNCYASQVPSANSEVRSLQSRAQSAQRSVDAATNSATNKAMSCMMTVNSGVSSGVTNAKIEANKCIKSANAAPAA